MTEKGYYFNSKINIVEQMVFCISQGGRRCLTTINDKHTCVRILILFMSHIECSTRDGISDLVFRIWPNKSEAF
ncbi:hypothetical protein ES705_02625 [subsurface metagenome]